jgi:hypothetical protein
MNEKKNSNQSENQDEKRFSKDETEQGGQRSELVAGARVAAAELWVQGQGGKSLSFFCKNKKKKRPFFFLTPLFFFFFFRGMVDDQMQSMLDSKTEEIEREVFRRRRQQEEVLELRKRLERASKFENEGDEVLREEITAMKVCLFVVFFFSI